MEASVSTGESGLFFVVMMLTILRCSEEEDPDEYPFPLTLRTKRTGPGSPLDGIPINGV